MVLVRIIAKIGVHTSPVKGQGLRHPLVPLIAAYRDWTALAVEFPAKIAVVFHLAEIRQHLLIRPFGVAPGGPVIIILWNATVQYLPIDGARTAGGLATRDGQPGLLRCELRHVAPVVRAIGREPYIVAQLEIIGQVREGGVIWPGLQQEHRCPGVLGQAGRHDTSRGAGANDNHIVPHQVYSSLSLIIATQGLTSIDIIAWHSVFCIQNTHMVFPDPHARPRSMASLSRITSTPDLTEQVYQRLLY